MPLTSTSETVVSTVLIPEEGPEVNSSFLAEVCKKPLFREGL